MIFRKPSSPYFDILSAVQHLILTIILFYISYDFYTDEKIFFTILSFAFAIASFINMMDHINKFIKK